MPKIITSNFEIHNAKQFVESFTEAGDGAANSIYYIFAADNVPYETFNNGTDLAPPSPNNSLDGVHYDIYREFIFGKKIDSGDVYHMCKRNDWTSGTVYDMYDNNDPDIATKNFFVVVNESGVYNVFKCLNNNGGAQSTAAPSFSETAADDDIYIKTADQYQWKFMFSISQAIFDEIATDTLIPIVTHANVVANAVSGAIDVITVDDPGSRYFSTANAIVKVAAVSGNNLLYELESVYGANVAVSSVSGTFIEEKARTFKDGANLTFSSLTGTYDIEPVRIANVTSNATMATANLYSVNSTACRIMDISGTYYTGNRLEGTVSIANSIIDTITATKIYFANAVIVEANSSWLRVTEPEGEIATDQKIENISATANASIDTVDFLTSTLSSNTDFYKNQAIYVASGTGAGQISTIEDYIVTGGARRILIPSAFSTQLDTTSRVEISPQANIVGDGTGAIARSVINTNSFTVDRIEVISRGSGYTYADVTVVGNTGIVNAANGSAALANNAVVSAILSPRDGHGADPISELYSSVVGMSVLYDDVEGGNIPITNDFRKVGVLKDPSYANTLITFTPSGAFLVGEVVVQVDGAGNGAYGTIVSETSSSMNLTNVKGNFTTSANIVGQDSATERTISTVQSNAGRVSSDFDTFDQRTILAGLNITASSFTDDNQVIQDTTLAEGYIQTSNTTEMALTRVKGNMQPSDTINIEIREQVESGGSAYFTSKIDPDLVYGSGEVMYVENMKPIERATGQTERIKIYIDF